MLINVPGFAPAWETAKNEAHQDLSEEEAGKSQPKRYIGPTDTLLTEYLARRAVNK